MYYIMKLINTKHGEIDLEYSKAAPQKVWYGYIGKKKNYETYNRGAWVQLIAK